MLPKLPSGWRIPEPDAGQLASDVLDDAKFVIQDVGNWIKNADAKSTVVAAATGVVATAAASKVDVVSAALRNDSFHCKWLLVVLAATAFTAVIVAGYFLYRALSPRTSQIGLPNRFAWPSLAEGQGLPTDYSWSVVQQEAWAQAARLAGIAEQKFTTSDSL